MSASAGDLAVVVGGASGIGAAVVAQHREHGTPVVVWDIAGQRDITCDVSEPAAVDQAIGDTIRAHGVPTLLTVCAGVGHSGMLLHADPDEWDRVMGVNARGAWLSMRAVARAAREAGAPCSMVAVSSVSASIADRNMGIYCASKAALNMLVRVAATEWAADGIRVNAVGPGVTQTPMLGGAPTDSGWLAEVAARTPLQRIGAPDDIAAAVLAVHGLGWVTGQILDCDGGLSLASPLDSYGFGQRLRQAPDHGR
jgi:NAD(P)-dependent dehydrogenase (short-subunit alcohol dehydrogenase family)